MNEMQIFNYGEVSVRTVLRDDVPWWVLKDVCRVLDLTTPARVVERLDEDEVSQTHLTDRLGRQQKTTIISESGLYAVILRSDKSEAKLFRRWVTHEVLPEIRKTGAYSALPASPPAVQLRTLTSDDYISAARIVADCRNEHLPYVIGFLKCGGFEIPEGESRFPSKPALGGEMVFKKALIPINLDDYL